MMRGYAEISGCRRQYLLNYFGEERDEPCEHCDTCESGSAFAAPQRNTAHPFPQGRRVAHQGWGEGTILRYEGDTIIVLFDTVGYKGLATKLVVARGLLTRAG